MATRKRRAELDELEAMKAEMKAELAELKAADKEAKRRGFFSRMAAGKPDPAAPPPEIYPRGER
jgi:hypothetical protein